MGGGGGEREKDNGGDAKRVRVKKYGHRCGTGRLAGACSNGARRGKRSSGGKRQNGAGREGTGGAVGCRK